MKLTNLVNGEVYYEEIGISTYISQYNEKDTPFYIQTNTNNFYKCGAKMHIDNVKRLATEEEKAWLNHCIKEDKFVPKKEFLKQYKQEFIVGKWYRLGEWISKFHHLNGNEFWGENICTESKFYDKLGWLSLNDYTPKLIENISEIQTFLPQGHPDKIPTTKKSLLEEAKRKYPIGTKYKCLHKCGTGEVFSLNDFEYDDDCIRTNNGCRCVYDEGNWAEIVNKPETKEMSIQEIQEECKKRFPIGCKFKCANTKQESILLQDNTVYTIDNNNIYASYGRGCLYHQGKYAELISLPEIKEKSVFEYVEYINTKYKGQIVKVEDWGCGSYCKVIFPNGNKEQPFKHLVKFSTKEAYENQLKQQYPLTPEQCFNSEIKVGDEVEVVKLKGFTADNNKIYLKANIGDRFTVYRNPTVYSYTNKNEYGIQLEENGYWYLTECFKLIKKANTTTEHKKIDVSSPKVTNRLKLKVRENPTVVITEERIKLKLNHSKTIKIKQHVN